MRKFLFLIVCAVSFIFTTGCGNNNKAEISKNKLVSIIVDLHKLDGLLMSRTFLDSYTKIDSLDLYTPIFQKHGVSRDQFERTIQFYVSYPHEFDRIYEMVITELTQEQTLLAEMQAAAVRDTLNNLWKDKLAWNFPKDGANNKLEVDIPLKGPGLYTFSAQIRLHGDDFSKDPSINLWFWYDDSTDFGKRDSFPATQIRKDGKLHFYSVSKELKDTFFTHIKGWILDHSNLDSVWSKHADVFQIRFEKEVAIPKGLENMTDR